MQTLSSSLDNAELPFQQVRNALGAEGFSLGGGWDYAAGSFDRPLEEAHKTWLRLPFEVTSGTLDAETDRSDAVIRFGAPYALRHEYEEGLDADAQPETFGGLVNQFQDPSDPDAPLSANEVDAAARALRLAEKLLLS